MSSKRLFQILDDMNVHDTEHGTTLVGLSPHVIEMKHMKKGNGSRVTMALPDNVLHISHAMDGRQRLVLMVIDGDEYDKRK